MRMRVYVPRCVYIVIQSWCCVSKVRGAEENERTIECACACVRMYVFVTVCLFHNHCACIGDIVVVRIK